MLNFPSIFESVSDLDKGQIDALLLLAHKFKNRVSHTTDFTKAKPTICTLFLENSTRTKHSFQMASEHLGGYFFDFDVKSSSFSKGENLEETLLTLKCQGVDLCIIRSNENNHLERLKAAPPLRIINGGDGTNEHPTQALLDLFTMQEIEGDLNGKRVCIVGDSNHSRVANSLIKLLPLYGVEVSLAGPKEFADQCAKKHGLKHFEKSSEYLKECDIVYLLRAQLERHTTGDKAAHQNLLISYNKDYGLNSQALKEAGTNQSIYHPGPCNIGIELTHELMRTSSYKGYEQVKHSIFMRMAIIQSILQNGDKNVGKFTNLSTN
ncbi:aspartate carbamoyltransferase catalytic subunit [Halobacteriovorax sp. GB3]|uniref:aspartate carbamoyltransferase catalytic subunit n=1 Tax=Halobacteriovorax sp. GB3 TaxID=2719615 RepID=UPI00235ECD42|nr:aspartate carbamoyltransferase catalytic subunit [Halobacteriovorax sp. GB3]MDD0853057.1 aspartate carbamoyltransferase catalytic subunit [Halobacteriovorax sp. GB3]